MCWSERGVSLYFYFIETILERCLWFCFRVLIPVICCLARWPRMTLWLFKTLICQFCKLSQTALCHSFQLISEVYTALQLTLICSIPSWHHGFVPSRFVGHFAVSFLSLACHLCHLPFDLASERVSRGWN